MFKTSKAPVTPGLRPGYDLPATVRCENRGQVVERTYDWSQRSWPGDRQGKMSCNLTGSMVMFKTLITCDSKSSAVADRSYVIVGPTTSRAW